MLKHGLVIFEACPAGDAFEIVDLLRSMPLSRVEELGNGSLAVISEKDSCEKGGDVSEGASLVYFLASISCVSCVFLT